MTQKKVGIFTKCLRKVRIRFVYELSGTCTLVSSILPKLFLEFLRAFRITKKQLTLVGRVDSK